MIRLLTILLLATSCGSQPAKPTTPPPPVDTVKVEATLNWPDRRPIGQIMLASNDGSHREDDHQWKLGGQHQFNRDALMQHADACILNLRQANAQGMITWDIEGQEFGQPYSYIGDPRRLPLDIDTLADEYFSKFSRGGFKVGICIRPDSIVVIEGWPRHFVAYDPYQELVRKIDYAYFRWGCRLFYVDSNIGEAQIPGTDNSTGYGGKLNASIFKKLLIKYPDCLIIPEHYTDDYLPYTAPLNKHNGPHVLPQGFQVFDIADNKWNMWQLLEARAQGSILMFRAWWNSPEIDIVKQAYNNNK